MRVRESYRTALRLALATSAATNDGLMQCGTAVGLRHVPECLRTTCLNRLLRPAAADKPAKPEPMTNAVNSDSSAAGEAYVARIMR